MKSLLVFALVAILALVSCQDVGPRRGHGDVFRQHSESSIKTSTASLVEAYMKKEERKIFGFFRIDATIINHSPLPTSGVHHGISNIINYYKRLDDLCDHNTECRVLWIDQVRGISALECDYNGTVRETGNKFDKLRAIHYIKWRFGRIQMINTVCYDYNKVLTVFETQSEKALRQLRQALNECTAENCPEMKKLIADDCEINVVNFYPTSLAVSLVNNAMNTLHLNPNEKKVYQANENNGNIVFRGHEGFLVLSQLEKMYILERVLTAKVLHSDPTTVDAVTVLAPRSNMILSDFSSVQDLLRDCTLIYSRTKFNQGKLASVQILLNRPFLPWEIRRIQTQLRWDNAMDEVLNKLTETKAITNKETKPEAKPELKPEAKPEAKPEVKPEVKPEAKPEPKPEIRQ